MKSHSNTLPQMVVFQQLVYTTYNQQTKHQTPYHEDHEWLLPYII